MADVVLNSALRANLLSLNDTQSLLDRTQQRLATGKKVNSALDNASAFFAARGLENRASDLSELLDGIGQATQTIQAATEGLELITDLVEQAQAIVYEARDEGAGSTAAVALEVDYDAILTQIDQARDDAIYRGVNLLDSDNAVVDFNEDASSSLTVTGVDYDSAGIGLTTAGDFTAAGTITTHLTEIDTALGNLRSQLRTFGTNLTTIKNRETFTNNIINNLQAGADKLTLADQNEEGANLLALQTRQQLSITSLSLAAQSQQAVLSLF